MGKVNILIRVDEEFADMLDDMKKVLYGRKKGGQSRTVEDALIALARQEKFEKLLNQIQEIRSELETLKLEVENEE